MGRCPLSLYYREADIIIHFEQGAVGVRGSNGPLKAVWVGGVQVNELVHYVTDEN